MGKRVLPTSTKGRDNIERIHKNFMSISSRYQEKSKLSFLLKDFKKPLLPISTGEDYTRRKK